MSLRLFFSYSHKDEALRDQLEVQLAMLKRQGLLETWHDRRILAGDGLDGAIRAELERADIILFLVSPDFLASDYCYEEEASRAMARHESGSARVIPVILRPCEWHHAPFGKLLAAPSDGKPITKWPDQDDAFLDVTRAIRRAAEKMSAAESAMPRTSSMSRPSPRTRPLDALGARSSNMRIAKSFTERDQEDFLHGTFEYVKNYFDASLTELEKRSPEIETRFRIIDADRFTATIYRSGARASACTIYRGKLMGGRSQIYYLMSENGAPGSYNEAVSVEHDDQTLFMTTMAMSVSSHDPARRKLTQEGVAETFWSFLIEPLQRSH